MRCAIAKVWLLCAAFGLLGDGRAPRLQPPREDAPAPTPLSSSVIERLAKLRPDEPEKYFELGEELADTAAEEVDKALPRSLYVLAFEFDRRRPQSGRLAASCALGLAKIERLERDRRWLTALAGAIDRRYGMPDWNVAAAPLLSDDTALKAATVLGLARSGDGRDARKLMDEPGVMDVLRRYERAIGTTGETGALSRLDKYVQQWPCPECHNARVVKRMTDKGSEFRLCPTCRGNPGPQLSEEELIGQLRFEAALLNGIQRSWAAQIVVDQGSPLRDPDPDQLADFFRVDPAKAYWRNNTWSATP